MITIETKNLRCTREEVDNAKDTDLPELLSHLGYQVKRIGRYHTVKEMDSIRIKNRRTWYRYSERVGGDAITFLQRFHNKTFSEAVDYLLAFNGRARDSPAPVRKQQPQEEKVPFVLPMPNPNQRRVFAYLRKRGIAAQVIDGFIRAGLLYEDAEHHNCVFVGRDKTGLPVFASKRVARLAGDGADNFARWGSPCPACPSLAPASRSPFKTAPEHLMISELPFSFISAIL